MIRNLAYRSVTAAAITARACLSFTAADAADIPRPSPAAPGPAPSEPRGIDARPARGERLTHVIRRAKGAMTIDADWNKAAWRDVPAVSLEHYMGDKPVFSPRTQAKMAWDDDNLYLIWRVEDRHVLARRTNHQDAVCRDSCVEFFFTPGLDAATHGYCNLEMNCVGAMWLAAHPADAPEVVLPPDDLATIEIASSLAGPIADEITAPTTWTLEYRLPVATIEKHCRGRFVRPAAGVAWRANFYKCAGESSRPHWLTWSPVVWKTPAFHMPQQFGVLEFED